LKTALIPMIALLSLNACSWYRNLERSLVDEDVKNSKRSQTVSREQYDQLLVKYEELAKKYEQLKELPQKGEGSLVDELQRTSSENFSQPSTNVETVDAFSETPAAASTGTVAVSDLSADIESQVNLYRRGVAAKNTNPGEATKIFQQLESQGLPAIKARARLQMGELLLSKGQYDLALQVFEDVISKNAHSGVVLEALRHAVVCSDKLGIQNKKEQYASMLNDVFETK
jgi:TolA-binding protein